MKSHKQPDLLPADFKQLIAGSKPVLVDFYADWCEPCKWLDPILQEVSKQTGDQATILKIDIDQHPALKKEYLILSVPVLIIFKNGEPCWRMNGFKQAKELIDQLLVFA